MNKGDLYNMHNIYSFCRFEVIILPDIDSISAANDFIEHGGKLNGDDIEVSDEPMTIAQAKRLCRNTPNCLGFTFESSRLQDKEGWWDGWAANHLKTWDGWGSTLGWFCKFFEGVVSTLFVDCRIRGTVG